MDTAVRNRRGPLTGALRGLWWISPTGAVALIVPGSLFLAASYPDYVYRTAWRTPKSLESSTVLMLFAGALVLMICSLIPQFASRRPLSAPWPGFSTVQRVALRKISTWLFWLTVFGYSVLGLAGVARGVTPGLILGALSGDGSSDDVKRAFEPITGITSFTQMGIGYVIIATLLLLGQRDRTTLRRLIIVLVIGTIRAFLASERLAILELLVPIVAILAMYWIGSRRESVRTAVRTAPLFLIPAAIAVFGIFEYSRSWAFYKSRSSGTFVDFAIERFAGYYATSYNNGQLALTFQNQLGHVPYRSLQGLWTAPGAEQIGLYEKLNGGAAPDLKPIFEMFGNPEFNNPCGICDPFVDFGHIGGFIFLACAGIIVGSLYRLFANANPIGLLVYPPLFTGLLELPRYLYWTQGRLLPTLVVLSVTGWWLMRLERRPGSVGVGAPRSKPRMDTESSASVARTGAQGP